MDSLDDSLAHTKQMKSFFEKLLLMLEEIFGGEIAVPPVAPPVPSTQQIESAAGKVADAAVALLGYDASPKNLAPQELSCAEGVSNILHSVYPDFPSEVLSTAQLFIELKKSPHFKGVLDPVRGCIIVSPTQGDNIGHTGIYTEDNRIASNDSRDGKFRANYTHASWRQYFVTNKGLKGYLFLPV